MTRMSSEGSNLSFVYHNNLVLSGGEKRLQSWELAALREEDILWSFISII